MLEQHGMGIYFGFFFFFDKDQSALALNMIVVIYLNVLESYLPIKKVQISFITLSRNMTPIVFEMFSISRRTP